MRSWLPVLWFRLVYSLSPGKFRHAEGYRRTWAHILLYKVGCSVNTYVLCNCCEWVTMILLVFAVVICWCCIYFCRLPTREVGLAFGDLWAGIFEWTWQLWCQSMLLVLWTYVLLAAAADYCGEKLAWFFGITSPKYQYVLDEFNRQHAQVT